MTSLRIFLIVLGLLKTATALPQESVTRCVSPFDVPCEQRGLTGTLSGVSSSLPRPSLTSVGTALIGLLQSEGEGEATFKRITDEGDWGDYEAFPDVCKLANGDLIVVFYAGYGHVAMPNAKLPKGGRITMMRSADNGATWSKPRTLIDLPDDDRDASLMQTKQGTLICTFMKYYGRRNVPKSHVVWFTRSMDKGRTWEKPRAIDFEFKSTTATSSPPIQLEDGTLLMPVYGRDTPSKRPVNKPGQRDRTVILRSTDDGKTWGEPVFLDRGPDYHLQEPSLLLLGDGRVLCVMRPVMTQSFSEDNGRTWSKPRKLAHRGDAPYLLRTSDELILCAHRHPGTSLTVSADQGKTWSEPVQLDNCRGAYPSMVELEDGKVLCVYYEEGAGSSIRQAVFRVAMPGPQIKFETPSNRSD